MPKQSNRLSQTQLPETVEQYQSYAVAPVWNALQEIAFPADADATPIYLPSVDATPSK